MFRKILVGYDGSESSESAFEKAIELAQKFQSKIYVLTVGRIPEYIQTIDEVEEAKTQAKKFYSKILQKAEEKMKLKNLDYEILLEFGKPSDIIIKVAETLNIDLIVLGTKKHSYLKRILGATVDKVVDNAHCSVLVVR